MISRLARVQAGIVGRWQLVAAGIHEDAIDRRLRSGRLHIVHPGVYAVGQRVLAPVARVWADVLRCGPDSRAGGLTSAALLGAVPLDVRGRTTIVVAPAAKPAPRGVRVRRLELLAGERSVAGGVPCLSPARTVLDVAATHGPTWVERVWRGLVHHGRLDMDAMSRLLEHHHGERGIVAVRGLFERRAAIIGVADSALEAHVARLAAIAGVPELRRNHRVVLSSGRVVFFDLCRPERLLAIEADGPYHDDPEVQADDARRDADAVRDGWHVERVHHTESDPAVIERLSTFREP